MRFLSIRVSVLGLVLAGVSGPSVMAGPPTNVDPTGPITSCSVTPVSATVTAEDPQARATVAFSGTPGFRLLAWIETFVNGTVDDQSTEEVDSGEWNLGPPWSEALAGKTWVIHHYSFGPAGRTGQILCEFAVTYAPVGGGGGVDDGRDDVGGGFDWDFSLDHYLRRATSETALPDTL